MRLVFTADKETLDVIKALKGFCDEDSESVVVTDSIHFLYQVEVLLSAGFKFALIDPDGKQFLIGKGEAAEDESEQDERETG